MCKNSRNIEEKDSVLEKYKRKKNNTHAKYYNGTRTLCVM